MNRATENWLAATRYAMRRRDEPDPFRPGDRVLAPWRDRWVPAVLLARSPNSPGCYTYWRLAPGIARRGRMAGAGWQRSNGTMHWSFFRPDPMPGANPLPAEAQAALGRAGVTDPTQVFREARGEAGAPPHSEAQRRPTMEPNGTQAEVADAPLGIDDRLQRGDDLLCRYRVRKVSMQETHTAVVATPEVYPGEHAVRFPSLRFTVGAAVPGYQDYRPGQFLVVSVQVDPDQAPTPGAEATWQAAAEAEAARRNPLLALLASATEEADPEAGEAADPPDSADAQVTPEQVEAVGRELRANLPDYVV